jgi:DHA1 family bicyclomycin/chloramphenicol resistance-like MFS transporter
VPRSVVATLAGLIALSALAVDITLVALPATALALGGDPARSGLIVTSYLAGFAPGQLLWGLLADRFGRRPAVLIGLAGFTAATIACAAANDFDTLLAARLAQGLAGGAGPVLARTIARDLASEAAGARLLALLTAVLGGAPLLAPLAGAALLTFIDWRSVFWATAAYGLVLLALAMKRLPESRPARPAVAASSLSRRTSMLLRQRGFLYGLALVALPFGGYHTLLALYPSVAMVERGLSEGAFAALFAAAAACFVGGSAISRAFVLRLRMPRLMAIAGAFCLAGALMTVVASAGGGIAWLGLGAAVYVLGVGQMLPLATTVALRDAGEATGWAVALLGLVQIGGGAVLSYLASVAGTPGVSLAVVLGLSALAAGVALATIGRPVHVSRVRGD